MSRRTHHSCPACGHNTIGPMVQTEYTCDGCGKRSAEAFRFERFERDGRILDACSFECCKTIHEAEQRRRPPEPPRFGFEIGPKP